MKGDASYDRYDGYKHISLGQAQLNKIHYIIRKAGLTAEDTVAELGCGWGGFAIEAAATTGCRITSYNLSIEQIKYAREKAARRGVDHLVTFVHADYRTVRTTFPWPAGLLARALLNARMLSGDRAGGQGCEHRDV